MKKRKVDISIISDSHLGTYGARAEELQKYLRSIDPDVLILNGDIIDFWAYKKSYWPKEHMAVVTELVQMMSTGCPIYYLTGNHDDTLRNFTDFKQDNFQLINKLVLEFDGKKLWVFHGDVFDASVSHARWLAKLGGWGYDMLIVINKYVNKVLKLMGKPKYSFSKKIKQSVKKASKLAGDFEQTAIDLAIKSKYDYVACGHIHLPTIKEHTNDEGSVLYLNSGDWVENLTSLEYNDGEWTIYKYEDDTTLQKTPLEEIEIHKKIVNNKIIEEEIKEILNTLA